MTKPDEYYAVNTLPALSWAFDLYFKKKGPFKSTGILEAILPGGNHKRFGEKGGHEISIWMSDDRKIYVKAKCTHDAKCEFNSERIDATDREGLKTIDWDKINDRRFFQTMRKWLMKMNLDFKLIIRAFATVCDRKVEIPLTTQYGRTFQKFDEYRKNRWPEETTSDKRDDFLEEVLVRVCFWMMTAAAVDAIKE